MGFKETFLKQGGMKLIKQYAQNGVLGTAVAEFILLGKERIALELLREVVQLKVRSKLEREFLSSLDDFDKDYQDYGIHESSDKVWICWFQGMDGAPDIVKKCYKSIKENLTDREVVLITSENMNQYVEFPEFIIDKWKRGVITNTHLSDLLRLELLIKYGGTWMDATVFCSDRRENIPDYLLDSDLFFYQMLKPGRDGHVIYQSSWFITARSNNKILKATLYLCYEYWKRNNRLIDYFLLHDFMSIVLDKYPDDWLKIVPRDNGTPHILLLRLFEKYDDRIWESIKNQTCFHKMSYKFTEEQSKLEDTFYKRLFC